MRESQVEPDGFSWYISSASLRVPYKKSGYPGATHTERPHRQRSHHPATTAFPGQMPSSCMEKLLRWTQLSHDYTSWGILSKTNSSIKHGQPTDYKQKSYCVLRSFFFSEIINQNNVQPLIQDFAFEISSRVLYPIIIPLQFLEDPNLLKWPIYSVPSPDWIPPPHSWIRTAFPRPLLAFHCQV